MLNNKKVVVSIVAVLLLLDLFLCLVLARQRTITRNLLGMYRTDTLVLNRAFESACLCSATVGTLEIANEIKGLGLSEIMRENNAVCILIPPYPCAACLSRLFDIIDKVSTSHKLKLIVLSPSYREKDTKAVFCQNSEVSIYPYNVEKLASQTIKKNDTSVLFFVNKGRIENVFITNKIFSQASEVYFKNIIK